MPSSLGPLHLPSMDSETTLEEPEAARLRFRGFSYQEVAGPQEALGQLQDLCRQWLKPEVHSKEQMLELLVLEQFLGVLPPEIQSWVRGQRPGSPEEAAALVEGLQRDPGQLLGWITAHVLKQEVLPATQKAEDSLGSLHPSGIAESLGTAPGERPKNAQVEGSVQLSCSVKKEPDADRQEMAPTSPPNPAQSREGPVGCRELDSAPFHPPRIQEDWGLLDPSQKELYWDAMLEKYGKVVSLAGLPSPRPDAEAKLEPGPLNAWTKSLRPGDESESRYDSTPGCPESLPAWDGRPGDTASGDTASVPPALLQGATRSKPYMCKQCGRGFDWKSVFVIHHRTHAGGQGGRTPALAVGGAEKPLQGPREPGAPRHHRRTPPVPRKYTCEECGRSFSWKSQLVIHRKSHTGQQRHFCGECNRSFNWKSQLVIHRKSHQPKAP